jgi:hypothetical protein
MENDERERIRYDMRFNKLEKSKISDSIGEDRFQKYESEIDEFMKIEGERMIKAQEIGVTEDAFFQDFEKRVNKFVHGILSR